MDKVSVSTAKNLLYVGGNAETDTTVSVNIPAGAKIDHVDYASSNANAAIVNVAGEIKAVKAGNAVITAAVTLTNGETKTFRQNITVKKAYIQKVKVPASIKKGKKVTLKAKAFGSTKKVTWSMKKASKVGKITKNGKFTAKKKGSVKVIAASGKVKKTFTIKVK